MSFYKFFFKINFIKKKFNLNKKMSKQIKLNDDKKILYNEIPIQEEEIQNLHSQITIPYQNFSFFDENFLSKILSNQIVI